MGWAFCPVLFAESLDSIAPGDIRGGRALLCVVAAKRRVYITAVSSHFTCPLSSIMLEYFEKDTSLWEVICQLCESSHGGLLLVKQQVS